MPAPAPPSTRRCPECPRLVPLQAAAKHAETHWPAPHARDAKNPRQQKAWIRRSYLLGETPDPTLITNADAREEYARLYGGDT